MEDPIMSSSDAMPVWVSDSKIDPSWIKEKMPNFHHVSECVVEDISNETRKGSKIKDGATLLLKLVSQKDRNDVTTLVAKQVPQAGLTTSRRLGLAREAMFYNTLAPKVRIPSSPNSYEDTCSGEVANHKSICAPCIPKIYYSFGDMSDGSKTVIMEDLSGGFVDSGILFGPGNPNNWKRNLKSKIDDAYPSTVPTTFEVANQTFLAIANVHAAFWRDKELLREEYSWLRGSLWIRGNDEASWKASQGMVQTMWENYLRDSNDSDKGICWDPQVRKIVEKAMKGISWESHRKRLNENTHFCLVHGDFWPGNIMVSKEILSGVTESTATRTNNCNEVRGLRLLDWEMVGLGSGPQELGQYILSNMDPRERRECEEQLVRNYYEKLVELGVPDFSWETCWSEYKIGGLERWIWFLAYFCAQPAMTTWAQFFHNQIQEFVHDHDISPEDVTQPRP